MNWLPIAALGYFLNAIAALVDKFLLQKVIGEPVVYTFFVSILSLVALVFVPFEFSVPAPFLLFVSLVSGFVFTLALFFFFKALKYGEVSRVAPLVGGISAIFIFFLAWAILGESLSSSQGFAFVFILIGSYFVAKEAGGNGPTTLKKAAVIAILAALAFALAHVLAKFVYVNHSFISGFVWRSLGNFLGGLSLLVLPRNRVKILQVLRRPKAKGGLLFFFGQSSAAVSFAVINYAFTLGPIALVNALSGLQYLFLFSIAVVFSRFLPNLMKEDLSGPAIWNKILGIIFIFGGIFFLFV